MKHGIECPECGGMITRVNQSNLDVEGNRIRSRKCEDCGHLFGTVEVALPGLSFTRTQRYHRGRSRIMTPEYVQVTRTGETVKLRVVPPKEVQTCRSGLHRWTPENTYTHPTTGARTCRTCRLANARERYHHARRKAPPSILEEQRTYWREQWRKRNAA